MNKKITIVRLQKEQQSLKKDPLPQAAVSRLSTLVFHFCLFNLEEDFSGGFYHGVIDLPQDYPFSPPKIRFLTDNGRFEVNKPICTTFTHYHKETWTSSWNIRTIVTALISFMYSSERGIGGLHHSSSRRKALAKKSLKNSISNPQFLQLFKDELLARGIVSSSQLNEMIEANNKIAKPNSEGKEEANLDLQQLEKIKPSLEAVEGEFIGKKLKKDSFEEKRDIEDKGVLQPEEV